MDQVKNGMQQQEEQRNRKIGVQQKEEKRKRKNGMQQQQQQQQQEKKNNSRQHSNGKKQNNDSLQKSKKDFPLQDYYSKIYEKYDLVNRVFTFGQDVKWRRKAVEECLQNRPAKFLDICTGTGDLVIDVARTSDREIELHGYDFSAEMLQKAREKASVSRSGNHSREGTGHGPEKGNTDRNGERSEKPAGTFEQIKFTEGNVADMPYADGTFDSAGITFGIRNLVYENSNADRHLSEIQRVLRPYGRLVILESSKPDNLVWRFFNNIYLQLILPYLGGIISGNLKAYRYLARSSKNYYTKKEMATILEKAGFLTIRSKGLFMGSVMLLVAEKQGT